MQDTLKMKKIWKNPWAYVIAAVILIGIIYGYENNQGKNTLPGQYDEFAKYLTEQGVKMYGTEWCPHCKNQKELFGDSFQYVDYVDCDRARQACTIAGVTGYPTWKINGINYPGVQSIETLAGLSKYNNTNYGQ